MITTKYHPEDVINVTAIEVGFFGGEIKPVGSKFQVTGQEFSEWWMTVDSVESHTIENEPQQELLGKPAKSGK